jgi:hypothetical protein
VYFTFERLSQWFNREKIYLDKIEDSGRKNDNTLTRFFPTTGGILRTMTKENPAYTYLAVDGVENCIQAIEDIVKGKLENCFIEMSACTGSCIGGPVMNKSRCTPVRDYITVSAYVGSHDFPVFDYHEDTLKKKMEPLIVRKVHLGKEVIEDVLKNFPMNTKHFCTCCGLSRNRCPLCTPVCGDRTDTLSVYPLYTEFSRQRVFRAGLLHVLF